MKHQEDDLQKSVATFLDFQKVLWCHVANERKSSVLAGKRMKDKGVKSGVPDVLIFEPKGNFSGLAVELKIKPNTPSKSQLEWLDKLRSSGWHTLICYSFDDFLQEFGRYINL